MHQFSLVKVPNLNDFLRDNLNKTRSLQDTLRNLQAQDILAQIEKQTKEIPIIEETINNTQIFLKVKFEVYIFKCFMTNKLLQGFAPITRDRGRCAEGD